PILLDPSQNAGPSLFIRVAHSARTLITALRCHPALDAGSSRMAATFSGPGGWMPDLRAGCPA
ncbi:hypothetical protein, partial [Pseudovibrio exalbescens]|uniref:hypothetical protein n=1 Tax=Pseudovibrio exalbescens TaxID=197461 RepID=UPI001AD92A02